MFSGIVGFGQYCAANTDAEGAMKIVKMLNELYTVFDALTDSKINSNVYKVKTNGFKIKIKLFTFFCRDVVRLKRWEINIWLFRDYRINVKTMQNV